MSKTYLESDSILRRINDGPVRINDVAEYMGLDRTQLSAVLHGRRPAPTGFERQIALVLDRMERAEAAAEEARQRVLAEK